MQVAVCLYITFFHRIKCQFLISVIKLYVMFTSILNQCHCVRGFADVPLEK